MNFEFSEKEEKLRSEIREFVKKELPAGFSGGGLEDEHFDEDWDFSMSIAKKLAQKGWLTMSWPKEYGGMDASLWEQLVYIEEAGYWRIPGIMMGISGVAWVGPSLVLFGSEEQKKKYMPLIAAGEADGVWCTGYSEPDAGTDFANLRTKAEKKGDEYIINGQKVWTSAAHRSRYCWLAVRTDPNHKKKHHGISIIIVDMKSEGVTVRPIINYVGYHIFNEVFFDDVHVPVENLVGVENNGWSQLMQSLMYERGSVGVGAYGGCKRMLDELVDFAKKNDLFCKEDVRQKIADIYTDVESLKMLAYQSIWKMANGEIPIYEPSRDKCYTDMVMQRLTTIGTEILGVYSQIDPLDNVSKWSKERARIEKGYWMFPGIAIAAGTTDTQRNIIGQFGLELPRSY